MSLPQAKISRAQLRKAVKNHNLFNVAVLLGVSRTTLYRLLNDAAYQPRPLLANYINAKLAKLQ